MEGKCIDNRKKTPSKQRYDKHRNKDASKQAKEIANKQARKATSKDTNKRWCL